MREPLEFWSDDERLAMRYSADPGREARGLETLFRRHVNATFAFSRRFLPTREDAEEATSECWLRVFRALRAGQYRGESRFKTWVLGIARNVCRERERQPRLPTLSLTGLTENGRGDWVLFAPSDEAESDLDRALATLMDSHRLILTLCDLQGLTVVEAAPFLGRSPVAAKSLHVRARRALRDVLEQQKREDDCI